MAWHKKYAAIITAALIMIPFFAAPSTALAASPESPDPFFNSSQSAVNQTVEAYTNLINSRYSATVSLAATNSSFVNLAGVSKDNVTKMANNYQQAFKESGYTVRSANISSTIVSQFVKGGKTYVIADVTTTLKSDPQEGRILTAGGEQDMLDSSLTDRHVMVLAPSSRSTTRMRILSDRVLSDEEYEDSTTATSEAGSSSLPTNINSKTRSNMSILAAAHPRLNRLNAALYALQWTRSNTMNTKYPSYGENCANFVSQALNNGGLPLRGSNIFQIWDDKVWSYRLGGLKASRTWTEAAANYRYMRYHAGVFRPVANPKNVKMGGLIYASWKGRNTPINHVMIVTAQGVHDVDICQKSPNRRNVPFSLEKKRAPRAFWHGLS